MTSFVVAGRLKVNMGNIYFKQKNYPKAVKFYRMALDQVPNTHRTMRFSRLHFKKVLIVLSNLVRNICSHDVCTLLFNRLKIMSNIGIVFTKMGQYNDAITSFEHIMQEEPDFKTGFNLILCYFALGDRDKMKRAFQKLLTVDLKIDDEEKYSTTTVCKKFCSCCVNVFCQMSKSKIGPCCFIRLVSRRTNKQTWFWKS